MSLTFNRTFCLATRFLLETIIGGTILAAAEDRSPAFVGGSLFPGRMSYVERVAETTTTDVVVLSGGVEEGWSDGMVCQIHRGDTIVGEILLVAVRKERSAGLILTLFSGQTIRVGDVVKAKTFKPS